MQNAGAYVGVSRRPFRQRPVSRLDGRVDVRGLGHGRRTDLLARRRITDVQSASTGGGAPASVDEEVALAHGILVLQRVFSRRQSAS